MDSGIPGFRDSGIPGFPPSCCGHSAFPSVKGEEFAESNQHYDIMPPKRIINTKDEVPNTLNDIELTKKSKKLDKKSFISFDLDDEILESPFSTFARPYPKEVSLAVDLLCDIHGVPERDEYVMPVLDALIRTILSQNTTDKTSKKAFLLLKKRFPTWNDVLTADNCDVEDAIRLGGLAEIKTNRIKLILNYIVTNYPQECGENHDQPSLEFLRLLKTW